MILLAAAWTAGLSAQSIWDAEHLRKVKSDIGSDAYSASYQNLIREADGLLDEKAYSVMDKERAAVSGDMHDYLSQARYYWPDPSKPDGLPYVSRDGLSNPEIKKLDRNRLGATAERVTVLSLAWYFSGDEKYAAKAAEFLRTWFLDKETKMNPHLRYAQVARGHNGDKGRSYGLIDTYSFVEMLDAVALLENSKSFTRKDSRQLKAWFSELVGWMLESPQGKAEGNAANNHSIAYDVQIASFAMYAGDRKIAENVIREFPEKRVFAQVEPDGSQPHELRRTLAFHYSWYNLTHMIDIAMMGRKLGIDVMGVQSEDGRSVYKALDFMCGYIGTDKEGWPWKQIDGAFDSISRKISMDAYRTAEFLTDDPLRKEKYMDIYRACPVSGGRFELIYF